MKGLSPAEAWTIVALTLAMIVAVAGGIGRDNRRFALVARFAVGLTFFVVVVGAFVRLSDAGLGCPDWPGCYGDLSPVTARDEIAREELARPSGPVTLAKAWKEMFHRYVAATLGAIILGLAAAAWRGRRAWQRRPWLAWSVVGVVILQGAFGAWTVTLLLKPAIVTGHLIGGMLTLSLLLLLALSAGAPMRLADPQRAAALRPLGLVALAVVAVQIALGGWTSTNYAALACYDWPLCQGRLVPATNFGDAFHLLRPLGTTADGRALPFEALTAIHWVHRSFAYLVLIVAVLLALRLRAIEGTRGLGHLLLGAAAIQVTLGITNVLASLPLLLAVAHNGGAAALLLVLVLVNHRLAGAARQAGRTTGAGTLAPLPDRSTA